MLDLVKFIKKFLIISLAVALAALLVFIVSCGPGGSPPPTSPDQTGPAPAAKLAFNIQPKGGVAGADFATQPAVVVEDAEGNSVDDYRGVLKLSITPGTGDPAAVLFGGTTVVLTNDIVEFKELSINKAGVYTLTASSGNLLPATSAPFTISAGEPYKLAFTVQTAGVQAGAPLTPSPEVTVQDFYGNIIANYEGSVTVIASVTYGASTDPYYAQGPQIYPMKLSGTTTVRFIDGVARFTDISSTFATPGYTLTAMSGSLKSATSASFTILPAAPVALEFTVQPYGGAPGTPLAMQPKVAIEDNYGNVVTSATDSVNVAITPGTGTSGAILAGTDSLEASAGLATFTDLSIDLAGSGYTLTATASGLPPATSQVFDVLAP